VAAGTPSLSNCTQSWDNQFHHHGLPLQVSLLTGLPHWTIYMTNQPVSKGLADISSGLVGSPIPMSNLRAPQASPSSPCPLLGHPALIGRILLPYGPVELASSQYDARVMKFRYRPEMNYPSVFHSFNGHALHHYRQPRRCRCVASALVTEALRGTYYGTSTPTHFKT